MEHLQGITAAQDAEARYTEALMSVISKVACPSQFSEEIRVTDPKTGGEKGQKLARLGSLDPRALWKVAEVAGHGEQKYSKFNYAKGYAWSLSYDALQRHLMAFWDGENIDPESHLPHLAHAAWHCLTLLTFSLRGRGTDDRFPQEAQ